MLLPGQGPMPLNQRTKPVAHAPVDQIGTSLEYLVTDGR